MKNDTQHSDQQIRGLYDVVVVGARAAGAATAMLLARRGLRVLAIDRSAYGSDTLSTHCIAMAGVLQLSRWGVLDRLREAGTPVANAIVFNYGDEMARIDLRPRGDVDGLYSPRRTLLDAALVDEAVASGAHVRHGVSMVGLTRDRGGRVDGVVIDVDGERRRVAARWVVGADGVRSKVAANVGAGFTSQDRTGAASIYSYWKGLPSDTIVNHYDLGRGGGVIPTNDDVAVIWTALTPEDFATSGRGNLAGAHHAAIEALPGLAAQLRDAQRVGGYRGFPGVAGFLREASGPGWALVGDASYFKDPVSAHGITDAFIGAELVSDAIADVAHCGVEENAAFERYQGDRDALAAQMMPPVALVAGLDQDMATVETAFRSMAAAMRDEWMFLESRTAVAA
jgi:flavin-dependent dehydrogenase